MSRAGFGDVSEMRLDQGLKGVHFGMPGRSYDIYYKQALWQGAKEHTVLHEAYEIIHETLCELHSGTRPEREVCRQADRFAAAVLMQPEGFALLAEASGLDVTALQREYVCSLLLGDAPAGRGAADAAPDGGPVREGGRWRPGGLAREDRAGRAPGEGGEADGGLGAAALPAHLRVAGRDSPQRQAPAVRLPGGAGGPQRRAGVRGGRRPGRGRQARLSGRGGWPRWRWSPCPTRTARRSRRRRTFFRRGTNSTPPPHCVAAPAIVRPLTVTPCATGIRKDTIVGHG